MNELKRHVTKPFKGTVRGFASAVLPDMTYFDLDDFVKLTADCNENSGFMNSSVPIGNMSISQDDINVPRMSFVFGLSTVTRRIFKRYRGNFKIIVERPSILVRTTKGDYYKMLKLRSLIKRLVLKLNNGV